MIARGADGTMIRIRRHPGRHPGILRRGRQGWLATTSLLVFAFLLTACGTDVGWLLTRDSKLVAEADKTATAAEAIDPELTTPLYDAEDAKRDACQPIYASISELMQREPSYGEQLASDLGLFFAFFFPIDELERCADAQAAYAAAIDDLRNRIGGVSTTPE